MAQGGSDYRRVLEERRKELQKELANRLVAYLKTEAGKKNQKELDEIDRARREREAEIWREASERRRAMDPNCCSSGEDGEVADWILGQEELSNDGADKERRGAIDKGMSGSDPEGHKEYQDAQGELDAVENEQSKIRAAEREADKEAAGDGPVLYGPDGKALPPDEVDVDGPLDPLD
jgi:hypothetical protein